MSGSNSTAPSKLLRCSTPHVPPCSRMSSSNLSSRAVTSPTTSTSSILSSTESSSTSTPTVATSTSTAPTSVPPTTQLITSVVTAPASNGGSSQPPSTVVITTQISTPSTDSTPTDTGSSTSSSSSSTAVSSQNKGSSNGLSAGGKTAIAVVIPVVVVALLLIAALFLWRKRKQRKNEEEERKKEMEEYGYNPNHDPTLPAVAATDEIAEDQSGYRGWGTTSNTTRKASTTMSGGVAQLSDGGYHSPGSPTQGASVSDHNSGDPLMSQQGRRETMDSETMGNLAAAGAAGAATGGVKRGPSNASSAYSAGDRSANSGDARAQNPAGQQDYYTDNAYYQPGPYETPYGNGQQPVIRDNPARRNTRIERPDVFPHQGTSGIAQNF